MQRYTFRWQSRPQSVRTTTRLFNCKWLVVEPVSRSSSLLAGLWHTEALAGGHHLLPLATCFQETPAELRNHEDQARHEVLQVIRGWRCLGTPGHPAKLLGHATPTGVMTSPAALPVDLTILKGKATVVVLRVHDDIYDDVHDD